MLSSCRMGYVMHSQGVAMTLNGIAQGYITDHVKQILAEHGYKDTIVNMGEYNAGDGLARIGIAGSDGNVFDVAGSSKSGHCHIIAHNTQIG